MQVKGGTVVVLWVDIVFVVVLLQVVIEVQIVSHFLYLMHSLSLVFRSSCAIDLFYIRNRFSFCIGCTFFYFINVYFILIQLLYKKHFELVNVCRQIHQGNVVTKGSSVNESPY